MDAVAEIASLAGSECFRLDDLVVTTKHLLLALVKASPAELLEQLRIDRAAMVAGIEESLASERNPDAVLMGTRGTQTPRAHRMLQRGQARADSESRDVTLRDLWFGFLSDPEAEAVIMLNKQGYHCDEWMRILG